MDERAGEDWNVNENPDYDPDAEAPAASTPAQLEHKGSGVPVPAIEITPKMRETILYTGQPLYKAEDIKRDIDKALIPSRRPEKRAYTERQALRISLQRQAAAASRGAQAMADRILGWQTVVADAIKKMIPEANQAAYLEGLVDVQNLDEADRFLDKLERDSKRLAKAADKTMLKEELAGRKEKMRADAQERANLRRLLQRESAAARAGAVAANREITDIKKGLVDTIEASLPKEERGQFLKMIASASNWKHVIKAINRIDVAVEKSARKYMVNALKREVQRIQASKAIAVDYRWRVNDLLQGIIFQTPTAATKQKLIDLQRYIDTQRKAGHDVTIPQYVADKLKILSASPLSDIPTVVVEDVLGQVRQLAELGRVKLKTIKDLTTLQQQRDIRDLTSSTVPINSKEIARAKPGEELPMKGGIKNLFSAAYNTAQRVKMAITPADVLFDMLDGMQSYAGPNYRIFKARVDADFGRYLDEASKLKNDVVEQAKGMTRKNFERIGTYAIAQQEGGKEKLLNNGLTEDDIKKIVLTPQEMRLYTFMRRNLDAMRPRIAETMKQVYNAELGDVKNYFPFLTDFELMDEVSVERKMLDDMGAGARRKNVQAGYTKARVGTGDQRVNVDAMDVYSKHVDDVAYLLNMGATTKYLGEVANSEDYKALAGNVGQAMVRDWIDTLARKGGAIGGQQIAIIDKLRRNVGVATLGFKLSSTIVQTTPLLEGAALIGLHAFQGAWNYSTSSEWRRFIHQNFPEIRERGGDDPAMSEFVKGGKLTAAREKLIVASFWGLKKLDEWAAASVAAGAYQKWLKEHGYPSVNVKDPNKIIYPEGIAYAQRMVRRTQASSFFKDAPLAVTRGMLTGNRSFDRALLQYQNFVLNQFSLLTYEGARAGILNGKPGLSINVWMWTILAIMATAGLRLGLDEIKAELTDEKHRKKKDAIEQEILQQSVQELLSRVPFVSQAMSLVKWGSLPVPAFDVVRRFGQASSGVYGYFNEDDKRRYRQKKQLKKAAVATAQTAGQLLGVPGSVEAGDFIRRQQK